MILKELKISGFRPFYEEQTLKIEPDVTVLTGANDVGKSAILDILGQFWSATSLDDVNEDRAIQAGVDPGDDESLCIVATYQIPSSFVDKRPDLSRYREWEVEVHYRAMHSGHIRVAIRDDNGIEVDDAPGIPRPPWGRDMAGAGTIRSVIHGDTSSPAEQALLNLAFESTEERLRLGRVNSNIQNTIRDKANERLAAALEPLKPDVLDVSLSIDYHSRDPILFIVALQDGSGGRAGPHLRGAGYQKLLGLTLGLLYRVSDPEPKILLVDEPENSLHADAQHAFRRVLEAVAEHEHIQVIYATHSPAMINPARPKSLRLLTRERNAEGVATARINNKPYADNNYQLIRSSLGMTPADSLAYAPITIIIEGATESLALNRLFLRLMDEQVGDKYSDLETFVGLIHFLPAGGSSFVRWAQWATSQGAMVIVFVDGDQITRADAVNRERPEIVIVHFDETREIEDIVPRVVYFEALVEYARSSNPKSSSKFSKEAFEEWEAKQCFPDRMLFSKRVAKWYKELFDYDLEKAEVMDIAIKLAKLEEIDMAKIDELIDAIRDAAKQLP